MGLEIIIETKWVRPEFSGEKRAQWRYHMASGLVAQAKYNEISKDDCEFKHTIIYLAEIK